MYDKEYAHKAEAYYKTKIASKWETEICKLKV